MIKNELAGLLTHDQIGIVWISKIHYGWPARVLPQKDRLPTDQRRGVLLIPGDRLDRRESEHGGHRHAYKRNKSFIVEHLDSYLPFVSFRGKDKRSQSFVIANRDSGIGPLKSCATP